MELEVKRIYRANSYTIGKLYINGEYFCDTLEDKDRNLEQSMDLDELKRIKIYGETAIPVGTYKVTLKVKSPKFSKYPFYMDVCEGYLPRLLNVPGFEGILIHVADGVKGAKLVHGCIGIGENKIKGGLLNGKETFKKFWDKIKNESEITIKVCH